MVLLYVFVLMMRALMWATPIGLGLIFFSLYKRQRVSLPLLIIGLFIAVPGLCVTAYTVKEAIPSQGERIYEAIMAEDTAKLARLLPKNKVNEVYPDPYPTTPLLLASRNHKLKSVEFLIAQGADVNLGFDTLDTPLRNAAAFSAGEDRVRYQVMETLIKHGADPRLPAPDDPNICLLGLLNEAAVLEFLLQQGADPDARLGQGRTPLMVANTYVVPYSGSLHKILIKYGADVNAVDHNGLTPLMYAARNGQENVRQMLIEAGADVEMKDRKGWTADDYAAARKRSE